MLALHHNVILSTNALPTFYDPNLVVIHLCDTAIVDSDGKSTGMSHDVHRVAGLSWYWRQTYSLTSI